MDLRQNRDDGSETNLGNSTFRAKGQKNVVSLPLHRLRPNLVLPCGTCVEVEPWEKPCDSELMTGKKIDVSQAFVPSR